MTQSSSPKRALIVRNDFSPFGNKLIQAGYVNAEQLKQALVASRVNNHPLTEVLRPTTIQRAGRPAMGAPSLLRGHPIPAGTRLA